MTGQTPTPKSSSQQRLDELVILNNKLVEQNAQLIRLATPKRGEFDGLQKAAVIFGVVVVFCACMLPFIDTERSLSAIQETTRMTQAIFGLVLGFGLIVSGKP